MSFSAFRSFFKKSKPYLFRVPESLFDVLFPSEVSVVMISAPNGKFDILELFPVEEIPKFQFANFGNIRIEDWSLEIRGNVVIRATW